MTKAEEYTIGKGFADGMTWENEAGESLRDVLPEGNRMLGSWASARLPRRSWRLDEDSIPYIMISDDNGPMYVLTRDHDESVEATRAWWFFEEDRSCVLVTCSPRWRLKKSSLITAHLSPRREYDDDTQAEPRLRHG